VKHGAWAENRWQGWLGVVRGVLAGLAALLPAALAAQGACPDGYSVTARQSSGQSYDPNQANRTILQLSLQVVDPDVRPGCTSAPVTIIPQSGAVFSFVNGAYDIGFVQLNSNLFSQANVTRFELAGNARSRLVRGETITLDLFEISAGQFPAAGEYRGTLLVQTGNSLPQAVLFSITVRPAIKFLAEQGAMTRDLSFGEVTRGALLRTAVFYQSNAAVSITIESRNRGRLVHEVGAAISPIPYTLIYDGIPINLATSAQLNRPFRGLAATREEMVLEVAPGEGRFAGNYRDVLTLFYTAF
jgi:hypothetical protein